MRMNKRRNKKITQKAFRRMAFSSALGILACIICLAGMTWAWFTDSVTSSGNTITSSHFDVIVTVKDSRDGEISDESGNFLNYILGAGDSYTVTITAENNAWEGHCIVSVGDAHYNTGTMGKNATSGICFTVDCVNADFSTIMIITPIWSASVERNLPDTITIGTAPEPLTVNATAQALTSPQVNGTPNEAAGEGNNTEEKSGTEGTPTEGLETESGSSDETTGGAGNAEAGDTSADGAQTTEETTTQPGADNVSTGDVPSAESNINTGTDNQQQQE